MSELEANDRESIADWIETSVLARSGPIGHDKLMSLAAEEIDVAEAQVGLALNVIASRGAVLGDAYPFKAEPVGVRIRPSARSMPYSLLLLLSPGSPARQLLNQNPSGESVVAFERLVVAAMIQMLGPGSKAVRFGWPSDEGRPPEFNLAIEWLVAKMGISPGSAYRPPRRKDGGVDVVAWRSFPDGKSGFPVFLLQCTLQGRLLEKSLDIDLRVWSSWLTLDADPSAILAVPGTIGRAEIWNEIALKCLVLDRIRLAGLLSGIELDSIPNCDEIVTEQLGELSRMLLGAQS